MTRTSGRKELTRESQHEDRRKHRHQPVTRDVFAFFSVRANDSAWMRNVVESEWLDPAGPPGVGSRGRMIMRSLARRSQYVDEVTEWEPGRRVAHRTVEGLIDLDTACIAEPADGGCRATVVAETDRVPGGRLAEPVVARIMRRMFRADLARLKNILEAKAQASA